MRLDRLQGRGLGPFTEFDINLAAIDALVIAITGDNGAGKTTLLELFGAAIHRKCPTRGKFPNLATTRDAFVEASIVHGKPWKIKQLVDKISGKGESVVVDENGDPAFDSSSVTVYDRWAKKHLPSESVFYSTIFAPQGSSGFIAMKPGARKAVLLRVLGIEHLEVMAERARKKALEAKKELDTLQARLEDERRRGGDVVELQTASLDAGDRCRSATTEKTAAETALKVEQSRAQEVDRLLAKSTEHATERRVLEEKRAAVAVRLEDLRLRIENNREVLSQADAIREAVERDAELAKDVDHLQERERGAAADTKVAADLVLEADRRGNDAQARATKAKARLADREKIEEAVASLEGVRKTLADGEVDLAEAEGELEELRGRRIAGAEERITSLRDGLTYIANDEAPSLEGAIDAAQDSLNSDDDVVTRAKRLPALLEEAMKTAGEAQIAKGSAWKEVIAVEKLADRVPELAPAEEDLAQAEEEVAQAYKGKDEAAEIAKVNQIIVDEVTKELASIEETRKTLAGLLSKTERLAKAEVRVEELKPQEETTGAELADLDQKIEAIPSAEDLPDPVVLTSFEERVKTAAKEATESTAAAAVAEKALANAKEAAEHRVALEAETQAAIELLADLNRIAADLGRDGLQALEIDAAGPELTELVNDLLHNCFGTRWTVSIDTIRDSADGKKEIEGLDVMVLDTEKGREDLIETYSGGEVVVLGEAVSLALTVLAAKRAGITDATLIRDESGSALDPKKGPAYISMLRRAAELTKASKVLFVSHSAELQELADARLHIEDGRITVI